MAETITTTGHGGDHIEAYFARPLGPGPFGGVVVIHHMPGYDAATKATQAALALYRQADDHDGIADALCELAFCAWMLDNNIDAVTYAEAACRHARLAGNDALLGRALAVLAQALPADECRALLEQAVVLLEQAGNCQWLLAAYSSVAYVALCEDRFAEAKRLLRAHD